ncbi:hypothetical protein FKM82_026428 [Ascaphus truei]
MPHNRRSTVSGLRWTYLRKRFKHSAEHWMPHIMRPTAAAQTWKFPERNYTVSLRSWTYLKKRLSILRQISKSLRRSFRPST